jgi:hypothetical protein
MKSTNQNRGQNLGPWTPEENRTICAVYLTMLEHEKRGEKYNKAQHRREGLKAMSTYRDGQQRTPGSWEMKCCNISALMQAARLPFIQGYKPLGNAQTTKLAAVMVSMMLAFGWDDKHVRRMERIANPDRRD